MNRVCIIIECSGSLSRVRETPLECSFSLSRVRETFLECSGSLSRVRETPLECSGKVLKYIQKILLKNHFSLFDFFYGDSPSVIFPFSMLHHSK